MRDYTNSVKCVLNTSVLSRLVWFLCHIWRSETVNDDTSFIHQLEDICLLNRHHLGLTTTLK